MSVSYPARLLRLHQHRWFRHAVAAGRVRYVALGYADATTARRARAARTIMVVLSPKTEYLKGKDRRACPVFVRLRPFPEEARRGAAAGEEYVGGGPLGAKYRAASEDGEVWKGVNLRSNLLKIHKRAGVAPRAGLWNSMRSSLITDLSRDGHPIQVITAWVGNSPAVALSNY